MFSCEDLSEDCENWKLEGRCAIEPYFMYTNCPLSCNVCNATEDDIFDSALSVISGCHNYYTACSQWAEFNECKINPEAMLVYCPLSCDSCFKTAEERDEIIQRYLKECEDDRSNCEELEKKNECRISPYDTLRFCRKTCGVCGLNTHEIRNLANQFYTECEDYHQSCREWEQSNECRINPGPMGRWCRKSCQTCGLSSQKLEEWVLQRETECEDDYEECEAWGEAKCDENPEVMFRFCRKTCDTCHLSSSQISEEISHINPECQDRYAQCHDWSMSNECKINPFVVLNVCQKSCGTCHLAETEINELAQHYATSCQDDHPKCRIWAHGGECVNNPASMLRICRQSCNTCGLSTYEIAEQVNQILHPQNSDE